MKPKLRTKQRLFFKFLQAHKEGDVVTQSEILQGSEWKPATLDAYRAKNYIDPFLSPTSDGRFKVRRDGTSISEDEVAQAFTQVRPELLRLEKGMRLCGGSGTYELQAFLGNGAVAHVWQAALLKTDTLVAVKVMNPRPDLLEPTALENVRKRFSREAKNGKTLSHPAIVHYRDEGDLNGHPFLVMDLADSSLAQEIKGRQLPLEQTFPIVNSCLSALEYLHEKGCVHRDVKPANILRFGGSYVLSDLGIVSWSDLNPAFTSAGTITRDSLRLGSWYYMAPEQSRTPHQVTPATDVYALGVSWYEMLAGVTPHPADVAAQHFPPATSDAAVGALIAKMLSYIPTHRPSISELLIDVRKLIVKK
jgi:serine/threonine protein kinase